jgi:hypothetical protein
MAKRSDGLVKFSGAMNKIDLTVLSPKARLQVIDCVRKNGKISISNLGSRISAGQPDGGYTQKID